MSANQIQRPWTFLSNHGHVLVYVHRHPDARVRELAAAVGVTERTALAILADLVAAGYLTVTRVGRRNSYTVSRDLRLRHPEEEGTAVGELLRAFR